MKRVVIDHSFPYLRQPPFRFCGHFQMYSLLTALQQNTPPHPKKITKNFLAQKTGFMLPSHLTKILKKHSIEFQKIKCPKTSTQQKIEKVKSFLHEWPVLLLIGRGYSTYKEFHRRRAAFFQHYISVRGYCEHENVFFCYDSAQKIPDDSLPIGNRKIPCEKLITYRNRGGLKIYKKTIFTIKFPPQKNPQNISQTIFQKDFSKL